MITPPKKKSDTQLQSYEETEKLNYHTDFMEFCLLLLLPLYCLNHVVYLYIPSTLCLHGHTYTAFTP